MGRQRVWTDAQLLDILRQTTRALGRLPIRREMRSPHATVYIVRFGSWKKAVKRAGLTPRKCGVTVRRPGHSPKPIDIREYWQREDPSLFRTERSDVPPHGIPNWTHPYARRWSA